MPAEPDAPTGILVRGQIPRSRIGALPAVSSQLAAFAVPDLGREQTCYAKNGEVLGQWQPSGSPVSRTESC
jgi:hypothetical protein